MISSVDPDRSLCFQCSGWGSNKPPNIPESLRKPKLKPLTKPPPFLFWKPTKKQPASSAEKRVTTGQCLPRGGAGGDVFHPGNDQLHRPGCPSEREKRGAKRLGSGSVYIYVYIYIYLGFLFVAIFWRS